MSIASAPTKLFHLEELPEAILIEGGGYISRWNSPHLPWPRRQDTLIYRGKEILSRFDQDMRRGLHAAMQAKASTSLRGRDPERREESRGSAHRHDQAGQDARGRPGDAGDRRSPTNTKGLASNRPASPLNERGAIIVDQYSRTNVPSIFALGDVTDRVQLTPVCHSRGDVFRRDRIQKQPDLADHDLIATAVFSQPEIGTVGMSEEQAAKAFEELEVYRAEFRPMKATLSGRAERMIMKLIVNAADRKVVGAHILGHDAGEIAQLLGHHAEGRLHQG